MSTEKPSRKTPFDLLAIEKLERKTKCLHDELLAIVGKLKESSFGSSKLEIDGGKNLLENLEAGLDVCDKLDVAFKRWKRDPPPEANHQQKKPRK